MRRRQLDWNPMAKAILFVIITCKIVWPLCNLTFGLLSLYSLPAQYLQSLGQPRLISSPTSGRPVQQSGTVPEVWMDCSGRLWNAERKKRKKETRVHVFKTPILMVVGPFFDLSHAFNSKKCWYIQAIILKNDFVYEWKSLIYFFF